MKFSQCFYLCLVLLLLSCGKSPLLNQKGNNVSGSFGIEAQKVFRSSGIKLNITWLTNINSSEQAEAVLITTKNGVLTDLPAPYSIYLWMPSMNHGSSPITITRLSPGVYKLTDIYFIMDGLWQLRIQLKSTTPIEEIFFEYNL
jgi:hypothetical protein